MVEDLIRQLHEYEKNFALAIMQAVSIEKMLSEVYSVNTTQSKEVTQVQIPFAVFEDQCERHKEEMKELRTEQEQERNSMRKHYRKIIIALAVVLGIFIAGMFGSVFYVLSNYDIFTYTQDATYGNANFIGNDGDISNGEADYYLGETEEQGN